MQRSLNHYRPMIRWTNLGEGLKERVQCARQHAQWMRRQASLVRAARDAAERQHRERCGVPTVASKAAAQPTADELVFYLHGGQLWQAEQLGEPLPQKVISHAVGEVRGGAANG